jgi:membrane protein involved in colicin uptake
MIAEELYRLIREVEKLEEALRNAALDERAAIEERLRKARAERNRLRGILDAKKK